MSEFAGGGVRLVVFDFDQTLSVVHVFKSLAGWGDKEKGEKILPVPRPYASTERGQVRRIHELDVAASRLGNFASAAFGGPVRVEQLRQFLQRLKEKDGALHLHKRFGRGGQEVFERPQASRILRRRLR